jgi:hypothetical protein
MLPLPHIAPVISVRAYRDLDFVLARTREASFTEHGLQEMIYVEGGLRCWEDLS